VNSIASTRKIDKNHRGQSVTPASECRVASSDPAIATTKFWQKFFDLADRLGVPDDFMTDRSLESPKDREIHSRGKSR
jgi:hypothetical protein